MQNMITREYQLEHQQQKTKNTHKVGECKSSIETASRNTIVSFKLSLMRDLMGRMKKRRMNENEL